MRVLSLDIGDRRIGMAISDPFGLVAQGLGVIDRKKDDPISKIMEKVMEYKIELIVAGLPKNMDGSLGFQSERVKEFIEELKKTYEGEVVYWDERLTTVSANRMMAQRGTKVSKRKDEVDKIAASYILEGYLMSKDYKDRKNNN